MLDTLEMFFMLVGTVLTVGTFSYVLFPKTRIFEFNQALVIGGGAAYSLYNVYTSLRTVSINPMLAGRWSLIIP